MKPSKTAKIPGLCNSCTYCFARTFTSGSTEVICTATHHFPIPLTRPVTACSRYANNDEIHLWQMKETAWILGEAGKGKIQGFMSPAVFRKEHPNQVVLDDD